MLTHTHQEFEAELRTLKDRLLAMGGRCEQMISTATRAFDDRDEALAMEVMNADRRMNEDELAVDELAVRILALRQPVGRDLRFAVAAVKVSTDLERIGDEAVNIAELKGFKFIRIKHDLLNFRKGNADWFKCLSLKSAAADPRLFISGRHEALSLYCAYAQYSIKPDRASTV